MTLINLSAAMAAKQILSFYDMIPAADQKAFMAGFVEMLSIYPHAVVERAVSPSRGLPAFVSYPNLAKFKEHLDEWSEIYWEEQSRKRLAPPPPQRSKPRRLEDPPAGYFGSVFVPQEHPRFAQMESWAKIAEAKWWRYGKSTDGRDGIWIPHGVWDTDITFLENAARYATNLIKRLQEAAE